MLSRPETSNVNDERSASSNVDALRALAFITPCYRYAAWAETVKLDAQPFGPVFRSGRVGKVRDGADAQNRP